MDQYHFLKGRYFSICINEQNALKRLFVAYFHYVDDITLYFAASIKKCIRNNIINNICSMEYVNNSMPYYYAMLAVK